MFLRFIGLLAIVLGVYGCETEVDLNAPYTNYTTIYGMLDLSADTQFVRINKTFLGEGSALDFAQVADSSEYPAGAVEAFIEFGNNTVQLEPYYALNRDPGVFYTDSVLVYITTENLALDENGSPVTNIYANYDDLPDTYRLVVRVNGKEFTAQAVPTYLGPPSIINPLSNSTGSGSIDVDLKWILDGGTFSQSTNMTMRTNPVGVRYESKVVFNFKEHYIDQTVESRSVEISLPATEVLLGSQMQQFQHSYQPEFFLQYLQNNLDCGGQVAYRTLDSAEFVMLVAGEDLARYIEVNSPVTGVVTERPEFSNIEGEEVIGVFSSRYRFVRKKWFNEPTLNEIYSGSQTGYTENLCFCEPGSAFDCPPADEPCSCE